MQTAKYELEIMNITPDRTIHLQLESNTPFQTISVGHYFHSGAFGDRPEFGDFLKVIMVEHCFKYSFDGVLIQHKVIALVDQKSNQEF